MKLKKHREMVIIYTLLCVFRLFAFMPLILICLCFVPIMYLLGVSDPLDKWVKLNEGIVFDANTLEENRYE